MSKEGAIRAFIEAGYPLIPLKGKKPYEENWEHTPLGKHSPEALLKGNYGVVLGPRDLVIDVDPRAFTKGDDPLTRLVQKIPSISLDTLVTQTGGGGLHLFFKKPAHAHVRNNLKEFPGLEFKGGPGRQVVGPGSIHPETGAAYTHLRGTAGHVPEAAPEFIEFIKQQAPSLNDGPGTKDYKDDEATKARCIEYLKTQSGAIQGLHGDETTFKVICGLRDRGISPITAFELFARNYNARCVPPWEDASLREKVKNAYSYARGNIGNAHPEAVFAPVEETTNAGDAEDAEIGKSGWKLDARKKPIKCFQNLLNYFGISRVGLRGVFGYNEFARCVVFLKQAPWHRSANHVGRDVQDSDLAQMRAHLARNHAFETTDRDLIDAMVSVSHKLRFHPVKEFLESLKWDGTPRLDTWLTDYLGVEDDKEGYARAVARKTLCAAVARIYEPGVKFDHVLILEGKQGLGKSGICKLLGGEWFTDFRMNVEKADTVQSMQGKWIVEIAELHSTRQTDLDILKSFLTRQVDEARFAYGRLPGKYPRQSIFIATYNPGPDGTYLKDDENRRWWPVKCHGMPPGNRVFDFDGFKSVRGQLWAEAMVLYKRGEKLTMDTPALQDAASAQQRERHGEDPWTERISDWIIERDKSPETRQDFYTGRDIYIGAMSGIDARFNRWDTLNIARVMRAIGWEPGFKRNSMGKFLRGYRRSAQQYLNEIEAQEKDVAIFGDLV